MPRVFGIEHGIFLVIVGIVIGVIIMIPKTRMTNKHAKIIALVLLVAIMWNRIAIAFHNNTFATTLPGTFCGASSLALAFGVLILKRNHPFFHSVAYIALLGGLITIIYPDFIGQAESVFHGRTISGLVHHALSVILVLILLKTKYWQPGWHQWHWTPIGLSAYMLYGLLLIYGLNYNNAMLIREPILENTPLTWWVMGILVMLVHAIFLAIITQSRRWSVSLGHTVGK